jgi:translation elongation factor EF-Tu-like GTPase
MAETEVGKVTHYFGKIGVAGVKLSGGLAVGDTVHILGHTTDLMETIESLEVNRQSVQRVEAGDEIGLKVGDHVREHDTVYRVE